MSMTTRHPLPMYCNHHHQLETFDGHVPYPEAWMVCEKCTRLLRSGAEFATGLCELHMTDKQDQTP